MNRPLEHVNIKLNEGIRPFYFRSDSSGDRGVIQQIFQACDYDLTVFAQFSNLIAYYSSLVNAGKKSLIIDAGASAIYFSDLFPHSRIVAIEPEKNNCQLLRKNCAGLDISVLEGGVGCNNGFLFLADPGVSDWGFRLGAQGDYQVPVYAADELVLAHVGQDFSPFLFKIDIEGGESELFRENTSWIRRFPLLIIELHDWLLPGQSNSRNFLRAISALNFDFVYRGENVFCFNNDLLGAAGSIKT